jgi:hypothetical protein
MENGEKARDVRPEIVESYRDFEPKAQIRKTVDDLLNTVPPEYLVGLKKIVLTNRSALPRDKRRQKVWGRGRKYRLAESLGSYSRAWKSSPATVWLYVDNIVSAVPPWVLRVPLLRFVILGDVLYHEIGHHIHAVHRRVYAGKENVAEDWSRKLRGRFLRRRYWFLMPILYPISYLIKLWKRIRKAVRLKVAPVEGK